MVTDPVSFFAISNACYKKSEVFLTSINFSEQMIIDAISVISASSAPGPDGIQASFWKKCAIELAVPLQMLFIQSLESGIIPECLKRAAIVPIYKSGDKSLPSYNRVQNRRSLLAKCECERLRSSTQVSTLARNIEYQKVKRHRVACTTIYL